MMTALVILQSFGLLFLMATYGAVNRMTYMLAKLVQDKAKTNPWPDREN